MPAVSKSQQQAAGMALAAKRGEISPAELKGAAKDMYDNMSEKQLADFAEGPMNSKPNKVQESNRITRAMLRKLISEELERMDETTPGQRRAVEDSLRRMLGQVKDAAGKPVRFEIRRIKDGQIQIFVYGNL